MKLLRLSYTLKMGEQKATMGVDLSDAGVLLIKGANAQLGVKILEGLLSKDFANSTRKGVSQQGSGVNAQVVKASLELDECKVVGEGSKIVIDGRKPNFHCITTLSNGRIRSFMQTTEMKKNELYNDTRQFNNLLKDAYWVRVVETSNKLFEYEAVTFVDKQLIFNFKDTDKWSVAAQKMAYTLLSESLLTPNQYRRVVLLTKADVLNGPQIFAIARMLKNMRNHGIVIITEGLTEKDIVIDNVVTCRRFK